MVDKPAAISMAAMMAKAKRRIEKPRPLITNETIRAVCRANATFFGCFRKNQGYRTSFQTTDFLSNGGIRVPREKDDRPEGVPWLSQMPLSGQV